MIKQEFRIEVDLPESDDTLHTTSKLFTHAYDITEDVSDWDGDFELNSEAGLKLMVDNKTRIAQLMIGTTGLYETNEVGVLISYISSTTNLLSQSFKPQKNFFLTKFELRLAKRGNPVDDLMIEIRKANTDGSPDMSSGALLHSSVVLATDLLAAPDWTWIEKNVSEKPVLKKNTFYCFLLKSTGSAEPNDYAWSISDADIYLRGSLWWSDNDGSSWNELSDRDATFKTYGVDAVFVPQAKYDKRDIYQKDGEWYTSDPGTPDAVCNKGFYSNQFIRVWKILPDESEELWFVGRVGNIKKSFDENGNMISLDCTDLTTFLKGVFVDKTYTNMEISLIVKQLFVDYPDTGITPDYVETTNIIISTCTFKDKNIYECIDELAKQASFDWYVDATGNLHFFRSGGGFGEWFDGFEGNTVGEYPVGWNIERNLTDTDLEVTDSYFYEGTKSVRFFNTGTTNAAYTRMTKEITIEEGQETVDFEFYTRAKVAEWSGYPVMLWVGVDTEPLIFHWDDVSNQVCYRDNITTKNTLFAFTPENPRNAWYKVVIKIYLTQDKYDIYFYKSDGTLLNSVLGVIRTLLTPTGVTASSEPGAACSRTDEEYFFDNFSFSPIQRPTETFEEGVNLISAEAEEDSMSIANKISIKGASSLGYNQELFHGATYPFSTLKTLGLQDGFPIGIRFPRKEDTTAIKEIAFYPNSIQPYAALSAAINATVTTFDVNDGSIFENGSVGIVNNEIMIIGTVTGDTLSNVQRGQFETIATAHLIDSELRPIGKNSLLSKIKVSLLSDEDGTVPSTINSIHQEYLSLKDFCLSDTERNPTALNTASWTKKGKSVHILASNQVVSATAYDFFENLTDPPVPADDPRMAWTTGTRKWLQSTTKYQGTYSALLNPDAGIAVNTIADPFLYFPSTGDYAGKLSFFMLDNLKTTGGVTKTSKIWLTQGANYIYVSVNAADATNKIQIIDNTGVLATVDRTGEWTKIDYIVTTDGTEIWIGGVLQATTDQVDSLTSFDIRMDGDTTGAGAEDFRVLVDAMMWLSKTAPVSERYVYSNTFDISNWRPYGMILTKVTGSEKIVEGHYAAFEIKEKGVVSGFIGFPINVSFPVPVAPPVGQNFIFLNINNFQREDVTEVRLWCADFEPFTFYFTNPEIKPFFKLPFMVENLLSEKYFILLEAENFPSNIVAFFTAMSSPFIERWYIDTKGKWQGITLNWKELLPLDPLYPIPFTCIMNDPEHQQTGISEKKYTDPVLSDEVSNYLMGWHKLEQLSRPRGNISIRSLDINPFILGSLVEFGCDSIATDDFPCYCSLLGTDDAFKMRVRKISIKYDSTGLDCSAELSEYRKDEDKDLTSIIKEIKFEQNKKDKDAGTVEGISIEYWLIDNMTDVTEWYKSIGLTTSQEKSEVKYGTASTKMSMSMTPADPTLWFKKEMLTSQQKNWKDKHYLEMWFNTSLATSTVSDFRIDCYVYDKGGTVAFEVNDMTLADINEWIKIIVDIHETLEYTNTDLNENLTAEDTIVSVVDATLIDADDMIKIDDECMKVISVSLNDVTVIRGYYNTTATTHTIGAIIKKKGDALDIHEFMLSFSNHSATETITPVVYIDQISILKTTPDLAELPVELSP